MTRCGSSPLARGTGPPTQASTAWRRFIPAGAGNRSPPFLRQSPQAVHPRWRGEQGGREAGGLAVAGSSPLARGTGAHREHRDAHHRFIPAGAGNRCASHGETRKPAVHPRWRGEQISTRARAMPHDGSSPLARGTAAQAVGQIVEGRFIPAGAGNRALTPRMTPPPSVHPRWRGEQVGHSP